MRDDTLREEVRDLYQKTDKLWCEIGPDPTAQDHERIFIEAILAFVRAKQDEALKGAEVFAEALRRIRDNDAPSCDYACAGIADRALKSPKKEGA